MTTETRAPKTSWCWFCRRAVDLRGEWYMVTTPEGGDGLICGSCWEKADEGPDVPLSYEDDREGQPEFNGAFSTW
jgi:hypothetical protein